MKEMGWSVALVVVSSLIVIIWEKLWLRPRRIRGVLEKQGIRGARPCFPFGNVKEMQRIQSQSDSGGSNLGSEYSDQWLYSLFPYLHKWRQHYGSMYVYSTGMRQHMYVGNAEFIRHLNLRRSLDLGRPSYLSKPLKPMLGAGILRANGQHWAFQRNLIAPEFFLSKIKNMVDFMEESTRAIVSTWESRITEKEGGIAEMVIDEDMKVLTADVISRACFGSSYAQGNQIFAKLATMQAAIGKPSLLFGLLNFSFLPTKENREVWKLKKEIDALILKMINDRELQNQKNHEDLFQIILESARVTNFGNNSGWGIKQLTHKHETNRLIVDICKNIYFAGSETGALVATWTLVLLAMHPDWQQRVRSEVLDTYSNNMLPHCFNDMDKFRKLKELTMVIQESLRLYGPAVITSREALDEMKVGELVVPKGINMWIFISALHRDPGIWGPNASEFKPERFAGGVSEACKYPQAYMPFGFGSRICVGQHFALVEVKIILSLLLSNFSFSVSPNYRHCPVYKMLLMPKYGARLLVSKVK